MKGLKADVSGKTGVAFIWFALVERVSAFAGRDESIKH